VPDKRGAGNIGSGDVQIGKLAGSGNIELFREKQAAGGAQAFLCVVTNNHALALCFQRKTFCRVAADDDDDSIAGEMGLIRQLRLRGNASLNVMRAISAARWRCTVPI
jgi:hypothetical protein